MVTSLATTFILLSTENKSQTNFLNDRGPKIEPYGTPNSISSQELFDVIMFVLSFLQNRQLCVNFNADKPNSYTSSFAMESF